MTADPHGWPLFLRPLPAVGVCSRCGRAGGCNCAAHAPEAPRLLTAAEVAALVAAARREGAEAMREACAQDTDCGCLARADVLARLTEAGHKRASYLCPHGDVCCALQAAAIRALPPPEDKP